MIKGIAHVAIATRSIQETLSFYRVLGLEPGSVEVVETQKVRVTMLPAGNSHIELIEPIQSDSPIARFLEKKGQGLHHISLEVDDIVATLEHLKTLDVRLIDEEPRPGAEGTLIAFIHPEATGGVLIELQQPTRRKGVE